MTAWTLALVWGLAQTQETPVEPPKPGTPGKKSDLAVDVRAGLELTYDDNVTALSDRDVERLEDGTRPDKFRIDEPDDFITAPWVEPSLKAPLFAEPTTFGLRAQAFVYSAHSVKDYQEYTLFARQRLGRRDTLEFDYEYIPEFYRREYRVGGTGPFDSAFYARHDFELRHRHRFNPVVAIRPEVAFRIRDYESPFDYRDSKAVVFGVRGEVEPLDWLEARLAFEHETLESEASSAEPDLSHAEFAVEPGVRLKPLPGLAFEVKYRAAFREYTTSNDPVTDPGHRDREDRIGKTTLGASYRFSKNWEVEAEVVLTRQDSDRPFDTGATDEETSYSRNVFTLGVTWSM
jgi:hypothetical protein